MEFETVIGLEIHAQLLTQTKIFCGCRAAFGAEQNTQVCPVCLGLPGVLPVLNQKVVDYAIRIGLATYCVIRHRSVFARKNYFYPDLPKGYQISQFEEPICEHGYLEIDVDGGNRRIGLTRIHMEEDAGKSIHAEDWVDADVSFVDVNRCGTPLVEMVTEPDIRSAHEAYIFLNELRQIVRYLEICDGNMDEGSLRCDANVSIRPKGEKKLGVKTELKNMNSFRGVEKALEYEIKRQIEIVRDGGTVQQETLLWDEKRNMVLPMRSKEMSHDYRYFPDPDLVPVEIDSARIDAIRKTLPELPAERRRRFSDTLGLPPYDAQVLTESRATADYFEAVLAFMPDAKLVSNWVMGEVLRTLNEQKMEINDFPVSPERLGRLLHLLKKNAISGNIAKTVFQHMLASGDSPEQIIEQQGLAQMSDSSELETIIDEVLRNNPNEVAKFRSGKKKLFGFLMGQVMQATQGKANPQMVSRILTEKLNQ